jgi:phospho-N-acetylmuramoyl-pentapeptide-transferase
MLYYLFSYLDKEIDLPGAGLFQFLSFRMALAFIFSLFISLLLGKRIIRYLQKLQIGEVVRDLGLEGQIQKKGTPTMGGVIIIAAIIIPVLLVAKLHSIYILLSLVATLWLGIIGFLDDYIKVFKKNKAGLHGKFKIVGQVGIGLIVGLTLYFNPNVVIRENLNPQQVEQYAKDGIELKKVESKIAQSDNLYDHKSAKTTVPFFKNNSVDYHIISKFFGLPKYLDWIVFVLLVIIIVTAVSNGANLTDGLDGLAGGVSAINIVTLLIFAYLSGNIIFASYLNILYIPNLGELTIFMAAMVGACVGFLWFNAYPAQVFMGDTGSLTLGGLIAVLAIMVRKELMIPIICGVFLIENLSVIIQVSWFKYTKKRFGDGKRVFLMSPLHHHYQKKNLHEVKIVTRFWIVAVFLALISIITLKIR